MKGVSRGVFAASIIVAVVVSCLATIGIYSHYYHPSPRTITVSKTVTSFVTKTLPTTVTKALTTTITTTVPTTVTSRSTVVKTLVATSVRTVTSVYTTTKTKVRTITIGGLVIKEIPVVYAHLFKLWNATRFVIAEDAEHQLFILVPRGVKPPSNATISALIKGLGISPRRVFIVEVPIKRAVFLSATEVALLYRVAKALGNLSLLDTVVGVSYGKWWIPVIPNLLKSGRAKIVATYSGVNYEGILALKPDVVFMYTGYPAMEKALAKLESLGLKVAVDNEWLENSYLGRFEWIKFIAAFYGPQALEEAIKVFDSVVKTYESLTLALKQYSAMTGKHPTFLWFFPSLKWGIWAPKRDAYPIKYLESIGARYVLEKYVPKGPGSVPVNKEIIAKVACKADVWIISGSPPYITSVDDIARVLGNWIYSCPAVKNHRVFFYSPSYWQLGYAYTELVLKDLASIMYPDAPILRGYERTFFHHLWRKGVTVKLSGVTITYEGFYKVVKDASGRTWVIVPFDLVSYVPKKVVDEASGVIELPVKSIVTDIAGLAAAHALGVDNLVTAVIACNKSLVPPSIAERVEFLGCPTSLSVSKLRAFSNALFVVSKPVMNELYPKLSGLGITLVSLPRVSSVWIAINNSRILGTLLDLDYVAQSFAEEELRTLGSIKALASLSGKPSLVCAYILGNRVYVATNSSVLGQLASIAGATYLATGSSPWIAMSLSAFAKEFGNASTLLILYPSISNVSQLLEAYPQLSSIRAVEHHRVLVAKGLYVLFNALSDPARVAKDLAACLHPQLYPSYVPQLFHALP